MESNYLTVGTVRRSDCPLISLIDAYTYKNEKDAKVVIVDSMNLGEDIKNHGGSYKVKKLAAHLVPASSSKVLLVESDYKELTTDLMEILENVDNCGVIINSDSLDEQAQGLILRVFEEKKIDVWINSQQLGYIPESICEKSNALKIHADYDLKDIEDVALCLNKFGDLKGLAYYLGKLLVNQHVKAYRNFCEFNDKAVVDAKISEPIYYFNDRLYVNNHVWEKSIDEILSKNKWIEKNRSELEEMFSILD